MLATYVQKSLDLILELCPMPIVFWRELQKISQRIFQHCAHTSQFARDFFLVKTQEAIQKLNNLFPHHHSPRR